MNAKKLKAAVKSLDLGREAPFLVLGWTERNHVSGGIYPIHEDMQDELRAIAQDALNHVPDLDMADYDGPTVIATGEEGLWVPSERLREHAPLFSVLSDPDELKILTAAELAEHALAFYAIGIGADEDHRTWFVKRKARQYNATTQLFAMLQGPLRPLKGNILSLDRDVDFILRQEGAVVFGANAFERYIQDPADVGAELDKNVARLARKIPFDKATLKGLRERGRRGSLLRRRLRSILERTHFRTLTLDKVRAEFRRLKKDPAHYIRDGKMSFQMASAQFVLKVLDESAWRGGFSDVLYSTSGKRKEN